MARRTFDHRLSTTLLISLVYPMGPAAIILMPMLIGGMVDDYGFSEQQTGYIASLEGMGLMAALLVAALWIRTISWTHMLLASFLLNATFNIISAQVTAVEPLLVLRFLAGFSSGSVFAIAVAALGDNREPDRAFGIAQVVQGVVMFAAFAVAPAILALWSVGGLYYMLAGVALLMTLSLLRYPSSGAERATGAASGSEEASYTLLIWIGLIASFLFFASIFGFWAYIERIGHAAGLPTGTIGMALGLSQFAAIVGGGLAAVASNRLGRLIPLLVSLAGLVLVLWLLVGQFTSFVYYFGACLFQTLFVLANSYQLGVMAQIDIRGSYLVLVTSFQVLGSAVGPTIAAMMINDGDYSGINTMATAFCVSSILMFLLIIHQTRHPRRHATLALAQRLK